jgi:hypothetical protein
MIRATFLIPLREAGKATGGAFTLQRKNPIRHAFRVPPSPSS